MVTANKALICDHGEEVFAAAKQGGGQILFEASVAGGIPVIASGGVTNMDDLKRLATVADKGILGAITGRAIYEGTLDVAEAQAYCDSLQA